MNATVVLVLSWSALFWLFTGIGLLAKKALGYRDLGGGEIFLAFWVGWGVSVALLQVWHIFFPVQSVVLYSLIAASVAGLVWNHAELIGWTRTLFSRTRRRNTTAWAAAFAVVTMLVAAFAIGPLSYDTGLYHLGVVDWQVQYPLVPGLANLHFRLGFNNSSHLYFSLLESGPWQGISQHVGVGLLAMSLLGAGLYGLRAVLARTGALHHSFLAFTLIPAFVGAAEESSGMSTDYPAFALAMVMGYILLRLRTVRPDESSLEKHLLTIAVFLAAVAASVKLSMALSAFVLAVLIARQWVSKPRTTGALRQLALVAVIAPLIVLGPWLIRGFVLSGYPAFPAAIGGIAFDWRVPQAFVVSEQAITIQWARWAGTRFDAADGFAWLLPWVRYALPRIHAFALPLVLALTGFGLTIRAGTRSARTIRPELLTVAALALPVVFWFATVPALRFVQGPIWVLGAVSIVLGVECLAATGNNRLDLRKWFVRLISILIAGVFALTVGYINQPSWESEFPSIPEAETVIMKTASGLSVWTLVDPDTEDRVFATELPSTPYFNSALRLRRGGEIRSGFSVLP